MQIYRDAAMWLFKKFLVGPAETVLRSWVALANSVSVHHKGALKSYSAAVWFLFKRYVTDNILAKLHVELRDLKQRSMTTAEYAQ